MIILCGHVDNVVVNSAILFSDSGMSSDTSEDACDWSLREGVMECEGRNDQYRVIVVRAVNVTRLEENIG